MVFRSESILERLKKLEAVLENLQDKPVENLEQYSSDLDLQWIVERGLGGFRNILVHDYLSLDHEIVLNHYKKAQTVFPQFIAEIYAWLEKQG